MVSNTVRSSTGSPGAHVVEAPRTRLEDSHQARRDIGHVKVIADLPTVRQRNRGPIQPVGLPRGEDVGDLNAAHGGERYAPRPAPLRSLSPACDRAAMRRLYWFHIEFAVRNGSVSTNGRDWGAYSTQDPPTTIFRHPA